MSRTIALAGVSFLLAASGPPARAADVTPQRRLAGQLLRAAAMPIESQALAVQAVDGSIIILKEAAEIDPGNVEVWRLLLKLADLGERQELRQEAIAQVVRLDPDDEVIRLLYINDAVERFQTVEERVEFYRKLLEPKTRERLGPAVASRVAADLAFLLDRTGDVQGFAHWLAEAVALDPSNRNAAATAAGFFRSNVQDPYGEAELLINLLLADPVSYDTQTVLAQLLLEHGAYVGADRMYDLASRTKEALGVAATGGLLADRAVAQWGRGDVQGALKTVADRQKQIDQIHRMQLRRDDPGLTPLDLARRHAPLVTTLATINAAIHNRLKDEQSGPALAAAVTAYEAEIQGAASSTESEKPVGPCLEAAWIVMWLGGDLEAASRFLSKAAELGAALDADAEARFDGWMALRQGDPDRAVALLEPIAERDVMARIGLALALREQGRDRQAARHLYEVADKARGSVMGVWCADVLSEMVGRRLGPNEMARRLEALAESIPSIIYRLPDEPTLGVSLRLVPAKTTFQPYEPVLVNLEITNNAPFPLAIDEGGPIRRQVALIVEARVSREPALGDLRPMVVDIDRRLRLEPGERLLVPVDLRRGVLAQVLNTLPLRGATISARGYLNFGLTGQRVIRAGLLGHEAEMLPIRVDGIRLDPQWVNDAIAATVAPDSPEDLETMALLGHVVAIGSDSEFKGVVPGGDSRQTRQLITDATTVLAEGYARLDEVSQAWLLACLPRKGPFESIYGMARRDPRRLVQMSYLLYCLTGLDDPMIDAAKRGDDPVVRSVAELMEYAQGLAGASR